MGEAVRGVPAGEREFLIEITASAPTAAQALRDNHVKSTQVAQAVAALGVQPADLQTISLNVYNLYSSRAPALGGLLPGYGSTAADRASGIWSMIPPRSRPAGRAIRLVPAREKPLRVNVREAARVGEIVDAAAEPARRSQEPSLQGSRRGSGTESGAGSGRKRCAGESGNSGERRRETTGRSGCHLGRHHRYQWNLCRLRSAVLSPSGRAPAGDRRAGILRTGIGAIPLPVSACNTNPVQLKLVPTRRCRLKSVELPRQCPDATSGLSTRFRDDAYPCKTDSAARDWRRMLGRNCAVCSWCFSSCSCMRVFERAGLTGGIVGPDQFIAQRPPLLTWWKTASAEPTRTSVLPIAAADSRRLHPEALRRPERIVAELAEIERLECLGSPIRIADQDAEQTGAFGRRPGSQIDRLSEEIIVKADS